MSCEEIKDGLSAYVDGELPPAEAAGLLGHLEACAACRREERWLRAMKAAVRWAPAPAMPRGLEAALMSEAARSRTGAGRELPVGWGFALAFAAAAFLLLARGAEEQADELPLDELAAAHSRYERTMPLASEELILAELPGQDDAGGSPAASDDPGGREG